MALRRRIMSILLTSSVVAGVVAAPGSAVAETKDFSALINAHNKEFDKWTEIETYENIALVFYGTRQKRFERNFYGCPSGSWNYKGLTNFDAESNGGVGGHDRVYKAINDNLKACNSSLDKIVKAIESSEWSPSMEQVAEGDRVFLKSTQIDGNRANRTFGNVGVEAVAAKRSDYLDKIARTPWDKRVSRDAALAEKHMKRESERISQAVEDSVMLRVDQARQKGEIIEPEIIVSLTQFPDTGMNARNSVFQAVRKDLMDSSKPWTPEWERTATSWATALRASANPTGAGKTAHIYASLVDRFVAEKRAEALVPFKNDGRSWTPEWDKEISDLANVDANARNLQAQRRSDFIASVTTHNPWNEIHDRQVQKLVEDSADNRVVLPKQTIDRVNSWRRTAVDGLAINRTWSPQVEADYSYLVMLFPEAKEQLTLMRSQVAQKVKDNIAARGWTLDDDRTLSEVAEIQHDPYGVQLRDHRVEALKKLTAAPWSPEVDKLLRDLATVHSMAADASQLRREKAFAEANIGEMWTPEAEKALAGLISVGHEPAIKAIDTLRANKLAELESVGRTPKSDVELASLAEFYPAAADVFKGRGGNVPGTPSEPGDNTDGTGTPGDGYQSGNQPSAPAKPGKPSDSDTSDGSSKDDTGSSVTDVKEIVGIVVAVLTAVGGVVAALAPFLQRLGIRF